MIRIVYFILIFILIDFPTIQGQNQLIEVSGKVKNSKNKKPLVNAEISIEDTNIGTVTNSDGFFSLKFAKEAISINPDSVII